MVSLGRRYSFSSLHRLHAPELSDERNREIFGKCNNPHGHGHNYIVEVILRGPVDEATGRVIELERLDSLVRRTVLDRYDHKNLNTDVADFETMVPTTENLAVAVERAVRGGWTEAFPGTWPRLEKIKIWETERNIFELVSSRYEIE